MEVKINNMKNKIFIMSLVVSMLGNFIFGFLYFSNMESKKERRLAMDIKCSTFVSDLKRQDEVNSKMDSEGIISQGTEVFFSPSKNSCLSLQKFSNIQFKNNDYFEMWTVRNLFTNEAVTSSSWIATTTYPINPKKQFILNEVAELKK